MSGLSVEKEKRLLFGGERWSWQANGSPFGDPIDRREIKLTRFCWAPVWQVIFCLGIVFFCVKIVFCHDRLGLG